MFVLDANVLIYTFRHDSPHHRPCYEWLTAILSRGEEVTAPGVVELALLRISTLPGLNEGRCRRTPGRIRISAGAPVNELPAARARQGA